MHNQGIVDVDPETELLFMCHLSRINLLQPFDQRSTGSQNTTCNLIKHFPIPMVLILFFFFLHGCLPDSVQHFAGILKLLLVYMYPWENHHPTVPPTAPAGRSVRVRGRSRVGVVVAPRAPATDGVLLLEGEGARRGRDRERRRERRRLGPRLLLLLRQRPARELAVDGGDAPQYVLRELARDLRHVLSDRGAQEVGQAGPP